MRSECYPITILPGVSRLFREYLAYWGNPILAESFGGSLFKVFAFIRQSCDYLCQFLDIGRS